MVFSYIANRKFIERNPNYTGKLCDILVIAIGKLPNIHTAEPIGPIRSDLTSRSRRLGVSTSVVNEPHF